MITLKNGIFKAIILCLAVLTLLGVFGVSAFAGGDSGEEEEKIEILINSPAITMTVKSEITMTVTVTPAGVLDTHKVVWSSDNKKIATVSEDGTVKGISPGRAIITASLAGTDARATFPITVMQRKNFLLDYLSKNQVASYRFSYEDNCFYADDKNCWQSAFGYMNIYNLVAPYTGIEIDFVRLHFDYEGKSWLMQLWKGQYGAVFYGDEIGIYTYDGLVDKDRISVLTNYQKPDEDDWLYMEQSLYRDELNNGKFVHQFTRSRDRYWWNTGFIPGHLWQTEPADELRLVATIEMKSEEMARIVGNELLSCDFKEVTSKDDMPLDSFFIEGKNLSIVWQNISEAESSVPVKLTLAGLFMSFLMTTGIGLGILALLSMLGLGIFIIL